MTLGAVGAFPVGSGWRCHFSVGAAVSGRGSACETPVRGSGVSPGTGKRVWKSCEVPNALRSPRAVGPRVWHVAALENHNQTFPKGRKALSKQVFGVATRSCIDFSRTKNKKAFYR